MDTIFERIKIENLQNDFNYTKAIQSKKIDKVVKSLNNTDKLTLTIKDVEQNKLTYNNDGIQNYQRKKKTQHLELKNLMQKLKWKKIKLKTLKQ